MSNLITGGAGFIGFHLSKRLLEMGESVVVLDNCNNYYDPKLKDSRLKELKKTASRLNSQLEIKTCD